MKNLISLLAINLLFINFCFSQYKFPLIEDVEMDLKSYGVNPNIFGGAKFKCSKNIDDPDETRFLVFFTAKFKDFSTKKTLDFNNISLVDVESKVRYRPIGVSLYRFYYGDKEWYADHMELDENENDSFTEYSQDGIENFDFYTFMRNILGSKKEKKYRYRLVPENFKSKSGLKFTYQFPVFKNRNDSGNFKIYWKDKLIGEFKIKDGKAVD
ncbi:hypothetical protein [uncultured Flavobacterium sp.]|uniref:hypothetical protein n=1 Tax=uncultured Flavobacterium sp. TaxID=165435 RepID=UPI0030EF9D80|tara:strand:+ start:278251 stop:278886 length:636 start_codon:yes stop_codon:yes gene_type:complete